VPTDPTRETLRRLSFIRYLTDRAVTQASEPEPQCTAALLGFHDAAELFLHLVSQKVNVGKRNVGFMEYFDLIDVALKPRQLPLREAMRQLNTARNALKHSGVWPSQLELQGHRVRIEEFLVESCRLVFDISFSEVSLVDLVESEEIRNRLKCALELAEEGRIDDAVVQSAAALQRLLVDQGKMTNQLLHPKIGSALQDIETEIELATDHKTRDRFSRPLRDLRDSLEVVEEAVGVMVMGIDWRRYQRFRWLAPRVWLARDGSITIGSWPAQGPRAERLLQKNDVSFCVDFVVEVAIGLASLRG